MIFFLISKKGSSQFSPLLGQRDSFGLLRITLLIFNYLTLYSTIFFLCGLADKFSNAILYAHDISNLKIPLDALHLRIIYLEKSLARFARSASFNYFNDSYNSL